MFEILLQIRFATRIHSQGIYMRVCMFATQHRLGSRQLIAWGIALGSMFLMVHGIFRSVMDVGRSLNPSQLKQEEIHARVTETYSLLIRPSQSRSSLQDSLSRHCTLSWVNGGDLSVPKFFQSVFLSSLLYASLLCMIQGCSYVFLSAVGPTPTNFQFNTFFLCCMLSWWCYYVCLCCYFLLMLFRLAYVRLCRYL